MTKLTHSIIISNQKVERRLIIMADYDRPNQEVNIESVVAQEQKFYITDSGEKKYSCILCTVDLTDFVTNMPSLELDLYSIDWEANYREKQLIKEVA